MAIATILCDAVNVALRGDTSQEEDRSFHTLCSFERSAITFVRPCCAVFCGWVSLCWTEGVCGFRFERAVTIDHEDSVSEVSGLPPGCWAGALRVSSGLVFCVQSWFCSFSRVMLVVETPLVWWAVAFVSVLWMLFRGVWSASFPACFAKGTERVFEIIVVWAFICEVSTPIFADWSSVFLASFSLRLMISSPREDTLLDRTSIFLTYRVSRSDAAATTFLKRFLRLAISSASCVMGSDWVGFSLFFCAGFGL